MNWLILAHKRYSKISRIFDKTLLNLLKIFFDKFFLLQSKSLNCSQIIFRLAPTQLQLHFSSQLLNYVSITQSLYFQLVQVVCRIFASSRSFTYPTYFLTLIFHFCTLSILITWTVSPFTHPPLSLKGPKVVFCSSLFSLLEKILKRYGKGSLLRENRAEEREMDLNGEGSWRSLPKKAGMYIFEYPDFILS